MDANILNLIIATARLMKIDYKDLALTFNERDKNQEYFNQLLLLQEKLTK